MTMSSGPAAPSLSRIAVLLRLAGEGGGANSLEAMQLEALQSVALAVANERSIAAVLKRIVEGGHSRLCRTAPRFSRRNPRVGFVFNASVT